MSTSITTVAATPPSRDEATRTAVARAAREFEAMFLLQMLKQMRQSMLSDEEAEPGLGADTMGDTIDSELARQLAGHAGLADAFTGPMTRSAGSAVAAAPQADVATPSTGVVPVTVSTLPGRVSSAFGWRQDPLNGNTAFHKGVDIRAAYGREVPAAADGVVVSAGTVRGYGESIVIDHGHGIQTRYAHLSAMDVAPGQPVVAGQPIGRVGQSGRATGPHLHFEVLERGAAMDPALLGLKLQGVAADYPTGPARSAPAVPGDHDED